MRERDFGEEGEKQRRLPDIYGDGEEDIFGPIGRLGPMFGLGDCKARTLGVEIGEKPCMAISEPQLYLTIYCNLHIQQMQDAHPPTTSHALLHRMLSLCKVKYHVVRV